ncbi:hypothetical protein SUGI_0710490 [Cryptomeria japonica]|uniref:arabinogalactan O-methyltransferase 1 n=1 Tax=Cryptomeria japonica TaxID=3369 RepID=UPI002414B217|nr:arabinogalactan O-methyltransferase 1 [Cryptomeria japonica]GLJ35319.1 hypothetical protein SUGI_0710490 [Cryptomeria japonica]
MKAIKTSLPENPWVLRSLVAGIFLTLAFISVFLFLQGKGTGGLGSLIQSNCISAEGWLPPQVSSALLHYATTTIIPQQNRAEIQLSVNVLSKRSPCNFLVFGLGHDSSLWNALNFRGKTLFLEEDSNWIKEALRGHPQLEGKAFHVDYPTKLSQADELLAYYRSEAESKCNPSNGLRVSQCKLALTDLPAEIYETEWDVIMIDAPRGYFDAAPGRMTAIYSAAVMASNRKKEGVTDVYLHDVNRRVEKVYAEKFLCKKNLVASSGRLWHFQIAPANGSFKGFCQ